MLAKLHSKMMARMLGVGYYHRHSSPAYIRTREKGKARTSGTRKLSRKREGRKPSWIMPCVVKKKSALCISGELVSLSSENHVPSGIPSFRHKQVGGVYPKMMLATLTSGSSTGKHLKTCFFDVGAWKNRCRQRSGNAISTT